MAADSFTNTTGTEIASHSAGGITWGPLSGLAEAQGVIDSNMLGGGAGLAFNVSARATGLTGDYAQVVFKGGTYGPASKAIHVRSSTSTQGYNLRVLDVTGDTITFIGLFKDDAYLTGATVSISRLTDHTVGIRATTVSSTVEIRGYLDGSALTFADTAAGNETPGAVFTDSSSPIASGNPAISFPFTDEFSQTSSRFDDFTDVEPGGGGSDPEITSISDATLTHGQTGVVIGGTNFGSSQGSGRVVVSPTDNPADGSAVNQTVTSWGATSITFTAVLSALAFGTLYVFVINDDDGVNVDGEVISRIIASATLNFTGSNNFKNKDGSPAASKSGMTFYIWRAPRPPSSVGTPDQIITSVSTDGSGQRSQSINLGSLDSDDTVYAMLFGADGNDIYWAGEVLPVYA